MPQPFTSGLTFFALYGTQVAIAQYLQWTLGLTALQAGLWTVPSVLAYLLSTSLAPVLAARFSKLRVIRAGLAVAATGCAVFLLVATGADLAALVTGTIVFGLGFGPVHTLRTDLIVTGTRPEQAGAAGAVAETGAELGGGLGIALLGALGLMVGERSFVAIAGASSLTVVAALIAITLVNRR